MSLHDLLDDAADSALLSRTTIDLCRVLERAQREVRVYRYRRAAASVMAAAAVVALVLVLGAGTGYVLGGPQPATRPAGEGRVPAQIYLPPAWTPSVTEDPIARAVYAVSVRPPQTQGETLPFDTVAVPVLISADGGAYRRLPWQSGDHELALSPDGRTAAWGREAGPRTAGELLVVLDVATGKVATVSVPSPTKQGALVEGVSFSGDGRRLAVATREDGNLARNYVWTVSLQDRRFHQVCACLGPAGWDDANLVLGPGAALQPGADVEAGAGLTSPVLAPFAQAGVTNAGGAWLEGRPNSVRTAVAGHLVRVSAKGGRLTLVEDDIATTVARTGGTGPGGSDPVTSDSEPGTPPGRDVVDLGPGEFSPELQVSPDVTVLAAERRAVLVATYPSGADSRLRPAAVLRVRVIPGANGTLGANSGVETLTRAASPFVGVVAVASDVVDRAGRPTAQAQPFGAAATDPQWWRYQARRALDGIGGVRGLGVAFALVALLALAFSTRRGSASVGRISGGLPFRGRGQRASSAGPASRAPLVGSRSGASIGSAPGATNARSADSSRRLRPWVRWTTALVLVGVVGSTVTGFSPFFSTSGPGPAPSGEAVAISGRVVVPQTLQDPGADPPPAFTEAGRPGTTRVSAVIRAMIHGRFGLYGLDAATGRLVRLDGIESTVPQLSSGGADEQVSVSPGGRWVAIGGFGKPARVIVVDLDTATSRSLVLAQGLRTGSTTVPGQHSSSLAVLDDGSFLAVDDAGALYRAPAAGGVEELRRFGEVRGVSAQPGNRFLLWRFFGGDDGPARLDLVEGPTASVRSWMTWTESSATLSPVAAQSVGLQMVVRTDDDKLVLHSPGRGQGVELGLPSVAGLDWLGASSTGQLVGVVAPERSTVDGADVVVITFPGLRSAWDKVDAGGPRDPGDPRGLGAQGYRGVEGVEVSAVMHVGLTGAELSVASEVVMRAASIDVPAPAGRPGVDRWILAGRGPLIAFLVLACVAVLGRRAWARRREVTGASRGRGLPEE